MLIDADLVEFVDVYQEKAAEAPLCVLLAFEVDTVGISEAQFGWQQEVEPGGFVGALSADEYQDDIVYGTFVYPSCYHRHEPFPEGFAEGHHGVSLHLYRGSEFGYIVLVAFLPGWEILQIIGEGIVGRAIVALDDIDHIALAHPCG